jgi:hypothetical protein
MKENQQWIAIDDTEIPGSQSSCGWDTILQLSPACRFERGLINTILSLSEAVPGSVYLGTYIYTEIEKADFGFSTELLQNKRRSGYWLLGICVDGDCFAARIHWGTPIEIECYDPQEHHGATEAERDRHKALQRSITSVSKLPYFKNTAG